MIFTRLLILLLLGCSTFTTVAQQSVPLQIQFSNQWQEKEISFPTTLPDDSLKLKAFRFYISEVELWKDGRSVWKADNSYHLIDATIDSTMVLHFMIPENLTYDSLQFNLGIDSTTNVAGVMGGDLDPTKGMYWTWNTGYINLKLEGAHPRCPTRKNRFMFHLGGYADPYLSMQTLAFPIVQDLQLSIDIHIDRFLGAINLTTTNTIMTPGKETLELSQLAKKMFVVRHEE